MDQTEEQIIYFDTDVTCGWFAVLDNFSWLLHDEEGDRFATLHKSFPMDNGEARKTLETMWAVGWEQGEAAGQLAVRSEIAAILAGGQAKEVIARPTEDTIQERIPLLVPSSLYEHLPNFSDMYISAFRRGHSEGERKVKFALCRAIGAQPQVM